MTKIETISENKQLSILKPQILRGMLFDGRETNLHIVNVELEDGSDDPEVVGWTSVEIDREELTIIVNNLQNWLNTGEFLTK